MNFNKKSSCNFKSSKWNLAGLKGYEISQRLKGYKMSSLFTLLDYWPTCINGQYLKKSAKVILHIEIAVHLPITKPVCGLTRRNLTEGWLLRIQVHAKWKLEYRFVSYLIGWVSFERVCIFLGWTVVILWAPRVCQGKVF